MIGWELLSFPVVPILSSLGILIPSEDNVSRIIISFIEKKYFLFLLIFLYIPTKSLFIFSSFGFSSVKIFTNFDLCKTLSSNLIFLIQYFFQNYISFNSFFKFIWNIVGIY